jgi:hypothetical protein
VANVLQLSDPSVVDTIIETVKNLGGAGQGTKKDLKEAEKA